MNIKRILQDIYGADLDAENSITAERIAFLVKDGIARGLMAAMPTTSGDLEWLTGVIMQRIAG